MIVRAMIAIGMCETTAIVVAGMIEIVVAHLATMMSITGTVTIDSAAKTCGSASLRESAKIWSMFNPEHFRSAPTSTG
jgi:hypothetical protein